MHCRSNAAPEQRRQSANLESPPVEGSKLACLPMPWAQSLQKGNDRRAKRRFDSADAPVTQANGPGSRQHRQNGAAPLPPKGGGGQKIPP